jgi:glycosyltransferase involved in cell wall biosynthesis
VPILASDAGGLPEVIDHQRTGFLFKSENTDDLVDKLTYIYINREKDLLNYKDQIREFNNRFHLSQHISRLREILSK